MANALYDFGRAAFLDGGIPWSSVAIKLVLVDTAAYTVNLATDQYLAIIPGGAIIATSGAFTGKTSTAGVADADDVTVTAVTGATVEALVIYYDTTNPATSPLIAYIDTATGLPVTPNGGDITVSWDSGANKIFKL
jgi:hypothetical protein